LENRGGFRRFRAAKMMNVPGAMKNPALQADLPVPFAQKKPPVSGGIGHGSYFPRRLPPRPFRCAFTDR